MNKRAEQAQTILDGATINEPEYMRSTGWETCCYALNAEEALIAIMEELDNPVYADYVLAVTQTCAEGGYRIWRSLAENNVAEDPVP